MKYILWLVVLSFSYFKFSAGKGCVFLSTFDLGRGKVLWDRLSVCLTGLFALTHTTLLDARTTPALGKSFGDRPKLFPQLLQVWTMWGGGRWGLRSASCQPRCPRSWQNWDQDVLLLRHQQCFRCLASGSGKQSLMLKILRPSKAAHCMYHSHFLLTPETRKASASRCRTSDPGSPNQSYNFLLKESLSRAVWGINFACDSRILVCKWEFLKPLPGMFLDGDHAICFHHSF